MVSFEHKQAAEYVIKKHTTINCSFPEDPGVYCAGTGKHMEVSAPDFNLRETRDHTMRECYETLMMAVICQAADSQNEALEDETKNNFIVICKGI